MGRSYLPYREGELLTWAANYQALIDAAPEEYGLSEDQASAYTALYNAFSSTFQVANDPLTRSPGNIEAKNTAKKALVTETRRLVKVCQAWPEMTDNKRSALGITVPDTDPTPVPVPSTSPKITVRSVVGRLLNLELRDEGSERRGRPEGVRSAWLYSYVGETMPTFEQMQFRGTTGKTLTQLVMAPDVPTGATVWVSACWVSASDKPGAVSLPVQTWTNHGAWQNDAA